MHHTLLEVLKTMRDGSQDTTASLRNGNLKLCFKHSFRRGSVVVLMSPSQQQHRGVRRWTRQPTCICTSCLCAILQQSALLFWELDRGNNPCSQTTSSRWSRTNVVNGQARC